MAGLKRKRTEQQHESEDEEDNEKTESQNPKAKKKSATVSNVKPSDSPRIDSSSSKAPVPKAEPAASSVVPLQAPKPAPPDRMAALRRAKDAVNQQQHSTLPTGPRVLSNNPNPFGKPNPQMLSSPSAKPKS